MQKKWIPSLATAAVFSASLSHSPDGAASEWEWLLTPYIWASDTSVDLSLPTGSVEGGVDFDDLIDKVDMGAQLHFEGRRELIGFFVDVTYLSINERAYREPALPLQGRLRLKSEMETLIGEVGGTYRLAGDSALTGFDLMLGVRVTDIDVDLDLDYTGTGANILSTSASETQTDVFAGGRYIHGFDSGWVISIRGDVGTGDSDITWNGQAELIYLFGKNDQFGAVLGYRYMKAEYESSIQGETVDADLTMSGPALGFAFRF